MYPPKTTVQLRLAPNAAEFLYWELLGLLTSYQGSAIGLEPAEERAFLEALRQLEAGLHRAQAAGEYQLEVLRRLVKPQAQEV